MKSASEETGYALDQDGRNVQYQPILKKTGQATGTTQAVDAQRVWYFQQLRGV